MKPSTLIKYLMIFLNLISSHDLSKPKQTLKIFLVKPNTKPFGEPRNGNSQFLVSSQFLRKRYKFKPHVFHEVFQGPVEKQEFTPKHWRYRFHRIEK